MTLAVATLGMTAMMAQSHEVTTTDKNGNKVVYEISDAPATKGDTLSITTYDPNSVAKSDSINGVDRNEDYVMTKEKSIPSMKLPVIIMAIGTVLTIPLLPLRSLIPAAFVNGLEKE